MNRKMISLLLALILASGTLASCANPKDPAETAGTESESATDTTPVETEPETVRYAAEVPGGTDLGGQEIHGAGVCGGGRGLERRRLERHGTDR